MLGGLVARRAAGLRLEHLQDVVRVVPFVDPVQAEEACTRVGCSGPRTPPTNARATRACSARTQPSRFTKERAVRSARPWEAGPHPTHDACLLSSSPSSRGSGLTSSPPACRERVSPHQCRWATEPNSPGPTNQSSNSLESPDVAITIGGRARVNRDHDCTRLLRPTPLRAPVAGRPAQLIDDSLAIADHEPQVSRLDRAGMRARGGPPATWVPVLCQGAALHYVNGKNGVKDFGVWSLRPA